MDVSCPQCKTEYEFEDARIPDDGLTVKCTQCAHVFRMKKKAPELPRPTEDSQPGREWRLKQASGTIFNFRRLTTLQKWIVERKVQKEDEISLTGDSWKRLGDIAELASFFQVVDDAARAEARASAPRPPDLAGMIPPPPVPLPESPIKPALTDTLPGPGFSALPPLPPAASRGPSSMSGPASEVPNNETIRGNVFSLPPASNPAAPPLQMMPPRRSAPGNVQAAERDSDIQLTKQGGMMKWVAVALMILGLGGGAAYYFIVFAPQQELAAAERAEAARQAEIERTSKEALTAQQKAAELAAKARADAEAAAAVVDAGPAAAVDAGAPVAVVAAVPDAGAIDAAAPKLPPRPKDFDQLMAEAERLRARDKSDQAIALFAKAAELKPQRVEPQAGGGFAYLDMGKLAEAEAAFRGALQVNPRYGPALIGMAESSKGLGKKDQAIEYYQKYLEVLPEGTEAKMAKGAIERLKGP